MLQPKPLAPSTSNMDQCVLQHIPSFSMGIHVKKKTKIIKRRMKSYYYRKYPRQAFQIYNGPRWNIPKCIPCSDSIKYKFLILETIDSFRQIKFKIAENIRNMRVTFNILKENQWKPSQHITSSITSFYTKQENEWNKVRAIYYRLFKFKKAIAPLILKWQIKKCIRNCKNIEDPITMEIPKKPIRVIDFNNRLSFVYEASSLRKAIENRLLLSDYMFPEPKMPVNLLTNKPFTYGQLISVTYQCKKYGQASWIIDSFKELNANLELFSFHNKQKLKIEAIKTFFKKSPSCLREIVIDYFNVEAEYFELPDKEIYRFIKAYDTKPEMPIVQQWIGITRDYYIAKELNEPVLLTRVADKTENILLMIYKAFLDATV